MGFNPNVWTIPIGAPFLETLVDALIDGELVAGFAPRHDPLALASATLYLPTRRAIRVLRQVFLDRLRADAVLLPRLIALGEVDEEEAAFDASSDLLDLAEAIRPLERQIALTRLILAWSTGIRRALLPLDGEEEPLLIPSSPGDAAALARDLGRFIDGLEIDRVPFEALARLKHAHLGQYDFYWDLTLKFLEIATATWPGYLAETGLLEPVERRNRLLAAETARIAAGRSTGPVVIAGSTGSVPATRDLIAAVAASPFGAVVLPGLDQSLDEAGWRAISEGEGAPGHPQYGLKLLTDSLGLDRALIGTLATVPPARAARARLVSQALRPASTTDLWRCAGSAGPGEAEAAFAGVAVVEAAHEGEEALVAAVALREALEDPARRAALVTPDRGLAGRVVAELARWGIAADDSAGRPLAATPPGIFTRLVLDVALHDFASVPVLALLKHPFATLGTGRADVRHAAEALEIGALRGPQPPRGVAGLRQALERGRAEAGERRAGASRRRLGEADWAAAALLIDRLEQAIGPFAQTLHDSGLAPAARYFAAHIAAVEACARSYANLYAFEAGLALETFFGELLGIGEAALALPPAEYPGLFAALMADLTVRGGEPKHPRLAIYGLLEARLLSVDRLVLGGLDEGIWPPQPRLDPWLNRPMRADLGLSAPEKRIGLSAHDFEQALGADDVIITRALKRSRAPTVASRWLQRLQAFAGETYDGMLARGSHWLTLARALDAPPLPLPAARPPAPRPPLALRPASLSVTRIEHLVRDPYTIYARHILGLEPLDDIAAAVGAADRGSLIHEAIRRFSDLCAAGVPADALAELSEIGEELFRDLADYPDVKAFWRPFFERLATFLAGWEAERRPRLAGVKTEIGGRISWPTAAGRIFTLTAQADRLEIGADGLVSVVDFKTGAAPSAPQVQSGMAPQLALEAAMILAGGFSGVASARDLGPLTLVHLSSGRDGCREIPMRFPGATTAEIAAHSLARLKALVDRFEDERTPYVSLLHPMFKTRRYGDYDHLARVREWSLASDDGEAE
jgi:ATP-dependent helicase/nuclease subunit B